MELLHASTTQRAREVKAMGRRIGFDDLGIAPPGPHPDMDLFAEWLSRGFHGAMKYMPRHKRRRLDPARALAGIRSVIVVALDYDTRAPRSVDVAPDPDRGWISRFAWGGDYHDVLDGLLRRLVSELSSAAPEHVFRHYVDHGPVLEKVFGRLAGLGWRGKHTGLVHPKRGSWFFLGVVLTDMEIEADTPLADRCGSCNACLDACPTGAIVEPYVLDARRCISYLTIEHEGPVPLDLVPGLGRHLFGCDVCQDVCPWNKKPEPPDPEWARPRAGLVHPRLSDLEDIGPEAFARRFGGTPVERGGHERIRRTASLVRGHKGGAWSQS